MKEIKLTLFVEVPDSFTVSQSADMSDVSDDELDLDDAIAKAIADEGYWLAYSEPYEEVPEE